MENEAEKYKAFFFVLILGSLLLSGIPQAPAPVGELVQIALFEE